MGSEALAEKKSSQTIQSVIEPCTSASATYLSNKCACDVTCTSGEEHNPRLLRLPCSILDCGICNLFCFCQSFAFRFPNSFPFPFPFELLLEHMTKVRKGIFSSIPWSLHLDHNHSWDGMMWGNMADVTSTKRVIWKLNFLGPSAFNNLRV